MFAKPTLRRRHKAGHEVDGELAKLMSHFPREGRVEWIGIRPQHRAEPLAEAEIMAITDSGLEGDHYAKPGGKRQVTLIQAEHLESVASLMAKDTVRPEWLRRNIVVAGVNLYALRDRQFRIGEATFEGTGPCEPCSRMEQALGPGGYNAMRGHGGITARIVQGGMIHVGDPVTPIA
jgi:MOSC domain-containing protein YiiM